MRKSQLKCNAESFISTGVTRKTTRTRKFQTGQPRWRGKDSEGKDSGRRPEQKIEAALYSTVDRSYQPATAASREAECEQES